LRRRGRGFAFVFPLGVGFGRELLVHGVGELDFGNFGDVLLAAHAVDGHAERGEDDAGTGGVELAGEDGMGDLGGGENDASLAVDEGEFALGFGDREFVLAEAPMDVTERTTVHGRGETAGAFAGDVLALQHKSFPRLCLESTSYAAGDEQNLYFQLDT